MSELYDIIIIGAGPAGLTAGIYASRAHMKTLILNEGTVGGQLVLTHEIANYPGVESTSGFQLGNIMKKQAQAYGCKIRSNIQVTSFDFSANPKMVEIDGKEKFYGRTVILSPGGEPRMIDVPGEAEFKGRGVSYCATCDGDFFTGKDIVVAGGGNSALEEAVSLTKYARKVSVVHQFDQFQAFPYAVEEAKANPKIKFYMESQVRNIMGEDSVKMVEIEHLPTGNKTILSVDGIFIFIGYIAKTQGFERCINLNERGEIIVSADMQTNVSGVFAAGDCTAKRYRQVTPAVGDGTIAALSAVEYLRTN
ncbi:MAG: FAD-dependent oxidoreductase [Bacteroidota bacterium]